MNNVSYSDIKIILQKLINAIDYIERINAQNDCNTCVARKNCTQAPKLGEMVRINCFAWEGNTEKDS